jgi:tetratricopeptide (TPR) repeat protein
MAWTCALCGYEANEWTDTTKALEEEARAALARGEAGRAMQITEEALLDQPNHLGLIALKAQIESDLAALRRGGHVKVDSTAALSEAENYHLQATFILHAVQANIQVYGSNSMLSGARPADVDLGLQYINRSLELFPDNPVYLNTKALLLVDGRGDKEAAQPLLEKAAALAPRDINIQNNLNAVKNGGCFIATAAFGTAFADELIDLRSWRDHVLSRTIAGRCFIRVYYVIAPWVAACIRPHALARAAARRMLRPLVRHVARHDKR